MWTSRDGDALRLTLDVKHKHLLTEERRSELQEALRIQLAAPIHLVIDVGIGSLETPAALALAAQDARQKAAETAIVEDPSVKAFQEHFGASIRAGSIKSL